MNKYTPFPGELTLPPPGVFKDTRFFYFFLRADPQVLQECCNRYLNDRLPAGFSYQSFGYVALAFTHVEELVPGEASRGTTRYKDIAFWIPVMARDPGSVLPRLCLFPPCIFVDDAATLVTGRELFGLPKQLARFEMPLAPEEIPGLAAPHFRLEVVGTLQNGGPRDFRTLATITARPEVGKVSLVRKAAQLFSELTAVFDTPSIFGKLTLPEALVTLQAVGLKQFRDVADPAMACHAAVVEAPLRMVELIDDPHLFRDAFELDLESEPVPSHPVCAALGLQPGRQTVAAAVYFRAHMQMRPGRVIGGKA